MEENAPDLIVDYFRKPKEICRIDPRLKYLRGKNDSIEFIKEKKEELNGILQSYGLKSRLAKIQETEVIKAMIDQLFSTKTSSHFSKLDIFSHIKYGYTTVFVDEENKIIACNLAIGYDSISGISRSCISFVVPGWKGKRLAYLASAYTSLIGLERGSRFRIGTLNPLNSASAKNLINELGYICNDFHPAYFGKGEPRFSMILSLSPAGIFNNSIDLVKVSMFLEENQEGRDYKIILSEDIDAIDHLYSNTEFKVVAIIPPTGNSQDHQYLALPKSVLNFPVIEEENNHWVPGDV